MENEVCYGDSYYRGKANYGSHVITRIYDGDKIVEGEPFGDDDWNAYIDDMGKTWHKGHLLAKSLGGENVVENLLPMTKEANLSEFKQVENLVRSIVDALPKLSELVRDGNVYVRYEVTVNRENTTIVKGYRFPSDISYSIKLGYGERKLMSEVSAKRYLSKASIDICVPLSGTIYTAQ